MVASWLRRRRAAPVVAESPTDGLLLGDLAGAVAAVDDHGRVVALDGTWVLEWGVGADDRWHVAHEEVAVRQRRLDDAPVPSTAMRVPGGDVVHRIAAVSDGRGRALVVEIENASAAAVAATMVVRAAGTIEVDEGGLRGAGITVTTDRALGGTTAVVDDPWAAAFVGPGVRAHRVEASPTGGGALVVPLPHRQQVRFTVLLDGEVPSSVAGIDSVASGWRALTAAAATIDTPDAALNEAWRRVVPDLVVAAGHPDPRVAGEVAAPLDQAGLFDEADRARATVVLHAEVGELAGGDAAVALLALASRDLRVGESSGLADLAGPLAELAGHDLTADVLRVVAQALDSDAPEAADDARRLAVDAPSGWPATTSRVARGAATVLGAVVGPVEVGGLTLFPSVPQGWLGGQVDVRGLVTHVGRISASVRWHGERPALLWEREGGPDTVRLRLPGYDPTWSSDERSGEALLAAPSS